MKKIIAIMAIVLGTTFAINAQTESNHEWSVGYQYLRQNKADNVSQGSNINAHGFNVGYNYFLGGDNVGLGGEVAANFENTENTNKRRVYTVLGGVTLKNRNAKYVQPYARALAGVGLLDTKFIPTQKSLALAAGAGLDFRLGENSRKKIRVGADYVHTRFLDTTQNGVRANLGFVF